jgi:hypothetical protein
MKKKNFGGYAGLILAAACMLVLSGCPKDPDEDDGVDERLVSSWTNDPKGIYTEENGLIGLKKTFTINADSTFTADINVIFLSACQGAKIDFTTVTAETTPVIAGLAAALKTGAGAEVSDIDDLKWKVTGKLTKIADETYLMAGLAAEGPRGFTFNMSEKVVDLSGVTPAIVGGFARESVKLQIKDDGGFTFTSASTNAATAGQVNGFFGGDYTNDTQ